MPEAAVFAAARLAAVFAAARLAAGSAAEPEDSQPIADSWAADLTAASMAAALATADSGMTASVTSASDSESGSVSAGLTGDGGGGGLIMVGVRMPATPGFSIAPHSMDTATHIRPADIMADITGPHHLRLQDPPAADLPSRRW